MSRVIRKEIDADVSQVIGEGSTDVMDVALEQKPQPGDLVHLYCGAYRSVWYCHRMLEPRSSADNDNDDNSDAVPDIVEVRDCLFVVLSETSRYVNAFEHFKALIDYFTADTRLRLRIEFLVTDVGLATQLQIDRRCHSCEITIAPTTRVLSLCLLPGDARRLTVYSDENGGTDLSLVALAAKLNKELRCVLAEGETIICIVSDTTDKSYLPRLPFVPLEGEVAVYHKNSLMCGFRQVSPNGAALVYLLSSKSADEFQRDVYADCPDKIISLSRSGPLHRFTFDPSRWEGWLPARITVDYPELRAPVLLRRVTDLALVFRDLIKSCDLVELLDNLPEMRFCLRTKRHAEIDRVYRAVDRVRAARSAATSKRPTLATADSMARADSIESCAAVPTQ